MVMEKLGFELLDLALSDTFSTFADWGDTHLWNVLIFLCTNLWVSASWAVTFTRRSKATKKIDFTYFVNNISKILTYSKYLAVLNIKF